MPVMNKAALLQELTQAVMQILDTVKKLDAGSSRMTLQPGPDRWNAAQVLEHLNFYNRSYLPRLESRLGPAAAGNATVFKSGWLGNYFTNMMMPKANGTLAARMSAPKDARPDAGLDARPVIQEFIAGEERLLRLLQQSAAKSWEVRIPTSISSLIRLKAGDTFRFLIAHQQRHMLQLQQALA